MFRSFCWPRSISFSRLVLAVGLLSLVGCGAPEATGAGQAVDAADASSSGGTTTGTPKAWAIAIHGGAGVIPKDIDPVQKEAYYAALREALTLGQEALDSGESSLDVVEKVVRKLEDAPQFNAGKGAVFTHDGKHALDAAIMDGSTLGVGAVTGVETVKNPISLARLVMTETRHVLLSGEGAEAFADTMELERVDAAYYFTQGRHDAWQRALAREKEEGEQRLMMDSAADDQASLEDARLGVEGSADWQNEKYGTVGVVALDRAGNLAAGTSTGGLTNKRWGRVGDVPIIGAGTYANDAACAVSGTGIGEQFIRHTVASDIAALVAYGDLSLADAAHKVVHEKLKPGDGGIIAVDPQGNLALVFNTAGMFRGAADADGRFDVAIWEDE